MTDKEEVLNRVERFLNNIRRHPPVELAGRINYLGRMWKEYRALLPELLVPHGKTIHMATANGALCKPKGTSYATTPMPTQVTCGRCKLALAKRKAS